MTLTQPLVRPAAVCHSLPTSDTDSSGTAVDVPSGEARTNRFMHFALAGVRLLNCVISVFVVVPRFDHYRQPAPVIAAYAGVVVWSAWLFGWATRGRMITVRLLLVDVVMASVPLAVVGMATAPHVATDWTNWSFAYALSVVLAAGAVLKLWPSVLAAAWLSTLYLGSVAPALVSGQASLSNGAELVMTPVCGSCTIGHNRSSCICNMGSRHATPTTQPLSIVVVSAIWPFARFCLQQLPARESTRTAGCSDRN